MRGRGKRPAFCWGEGVWEESPVVKARKRMRRPNKGVESLQTAILLKGKTSRSRLRGKGTSKKEGGMIVGDRRREDTWGRGNNRLY